MSEPTNTKSNIGTRFPFISLEKAIERAQQLFDADQKGREMAVTGAFSAWDYSDKSSGGFQTVAALKMYGLIKDTEGGDIRKIALTEDALRYFRDERIEEKTKLLRQFALQPKLIAALWNDWHDTPPADMIARSHLKAERSLNDQGARSLLAIYKENLMFAELKGSDMIEPDSANGTGSERGDEKPENKPPPPPQPQPAGTTRVKGREVKAGMKEDIFTLKEGDVVFQWPERLSQESFDDLEAWTQLILRKVKRHIGELTSDGKENSNNGQE